MGYVLPVTWLPCHLVAQIIEYAKHIEFVTENWVLSPSSSRVYRGRSVITFPLFSNNEVTVPGFPLPSQGNPTFLLGKTA